MVRRRTCPGPRSDRRRHGARGEAYTWVVAVRHPGPPPSRSRGRSGSRRRMCRACCAARSSIWARSTPPTPP